MKRISLTRFFSDEAGSVLTLVGLSMLFLFAAGGAGYDLGRLDLVSQKEQQSSDAAALAGASLPTSATDTDRKNEALRYFALNYPASFLGVARPTPTVTVDSTGLVVNVQSAMNQNFVSNVGGGGMTAAGKSTVGLSASQSSDYDAVMIVDESGSEGSPSPPYATREQAQQAALTTMANTIVPAGNTNPNVRMGFVGFTGYISNKWGLSSNNADAITAISKMRPLDQNFDHMALLGAMNMLLGGQGAANGQITMGSPYGPTGLGGTVSANTTMPAPRTARTNTVDAHGIAPTKFVVFLSDGGIMLEPDDSHDLNQDPSGLVHTHCPGRTDFGTECFAAFNDACTQLKNMSGITDNVHVFIINLNQMVTASELSSLTQCASATIPGGTTVYTAQQKPNPARDFFYAVDAATLQSILKNITTVIQKERITQ